MHSFLMTSLIRLAPVGNHRPSVDGLGQVSHGDTSNKHVVGVFGMTKQSFLSDSE